MGDDAVPGRDLGKKRKSLPPQTQTAEPVKKKPKTDGSINDPGARQQSADGLPAPFEATDSSSKPQQLTRTQLASLVEQEKHVAKKWQHALRLRV